MDAAISNLALTIGYQWTTIVSYLGSYETIDVSMPPEIRYSSDATKAAFAIRWVLSHGKTKEDIGLVLAADTFRTQVGMPPYYDRRIQNYQLASQPVVSIRFLQHLCSNPYILHLLLNNHLV
jgi:hypothetical protein